ncbi:MAG: DUF3757 domain-containing protein [bacterium]|nr:DUF3757 domain-containing protein [bacterium]
MKKFKILILVLLGIQSLASYANTCPDPETTSLKWGVIPLPWLANPFSANTPQGEKGTIFKRVSILVAGYGQGVTCTYHNSLGLYSIWWPIITKIPAPVDYQWINTLGGFACSQGLNQCFFEVLSN